MKKPVKITISIVLIIFSQACKEEKKPQPPGMISVPQFEFISQSTVNDSTSNINMSLDAFYISNEITNREYREFTDWVKNNPDRTLSRSINVIVDTNEQKGKTRVWTVPYFIEMSDLLPSLIDSDAIYRVDSRYKDYFTDSKYDDYPVVGVSRNAAEYYCRWLEMLDIETSVVTLKLEGPDGKKLKEKVTMNKGPSNLDYRIPLEMEWEYVARQPYRRIPVNNGKLKKVSEGNSNRWGILHLHDNVSEWVTGTEDLYAVYKGNNWLNGRGDSYLMHLHPDSGKGYIGFRVARTYEPEEINAE
jgi:hypothetical protein